MPARPRFSPDILAALHKGQRLRLRAGSTHRFTGIWVVVVNERVFVRSWALKPGGWYRAFLQEPRGAIQIADLQIPVQAIRTKSEQAKAAVDRAYLEKYHSPGAIQYARDLVKEACRAATLELVPRRPG
jgi:hypothetical protein